MLPAINEHHVQPTDFSRAQEMIESALAGARKTLEAAGHRAAAAH